MFRMVMGFRSILSIPHMMNGAEFGVMNQYF